MISSSVERLAFQLLSKPGAKVDKIDLSGFAKCDQRTAQRILKRIHESTPNIRIVDWRRCYHAPIPAYGISTERDKKRPRPTTSAERQRKRRKDPEVKMKELNAKRAKRFLERQSKEAA